MSDPDDEELPEAVRLHAALAIACLALDLIALGTLSDPRAGARAAVKLLLRDYPETHEHLTPEKGS